MSRARRKSPSVKTPISLPMTLVTAVMPSPPRVTSMIASLTAAWSLTQGSASPACIRSSTFINRRRPKAPPGWEKAKSSAVKPRASNSAIASASPIASAAVVLDVGAKFSGQASRLTATVKCAWLAWPSGLSGLLLMPTSLLPRRASSGSIATTSPDEPELLSPMTTSSLVIMPMSPWLASPG